MVEICAIASGSNGNCYYIGNEKSAILVDAGIYYSRVVERFESAGLSLDKVKAVFISHEHHDHMVGLKVLSKKQSIPGVFSQKTYAALHKKIKPEFFSYFEENKAYEIDDIKVVPFAKQHDAADPFSFVVEIEGKTIGVMTDLGIVTEDVGEQIAKCQALFLETNYDERLLVTSSYPFYLKQRITSNVGHLSNHQAKEAVLKYGNENLSHIFLSHISAENNEPEIVAELFEEIGERSEIIVTSRHRASKVVRL